MKVWKVTFENPSERSLRNLTVEFVDVIDLFGHGLGIDKSFIDKLMELIEKRENYNLISNIKKVVDPEDTDLSEHAIFALLCEDSNHTNFSFLLGQSTEDDWLLLGIWPDTFAKIFKQNQQHIDVTLSNIISEPDMWEEIDLIMPLQTKK
ncbi:MAG: hypothetical protein ACP6IU_03040 [Candidatus Asgardarchaeia archaeon]